MQKIAKSQGINDSEKYLAQLCEKSFLHLWSYPNLYRKTNDCNELCDLLVVFENDIIIFSDKSRDFPNTGDIRTDWNRWYRKAIKGSAKQIFGAERWIQNYPERIYLDKKFTQPFPITLPSKDDCRFHRVVVAKGASLRCKQYLSDKQGSLMIVPRITGDSHIDGTNPPFCIGQINPQKGFVHVLDEVTLDIILKELDTVSDFVAYLVKKENLIRSNRLVSAAGEEELLAYYLTRINEENEHDFVFPPDITHITLDVNIWKSYTRDHQYVAKKEADKISYYWDSLIERFSKNIISGSLLTLGDNLNIGNHEYRIADHEKGVRILASEHRTSRRGLMESIIELMRKTPETSSMVRVMFSPADKLRGYICLSFPYTGEEGYEEYRFKRLSVLFNYCYVLKFKFPELKEVVGIAFQPPSNQCNQFGEDLLPLNIEKWTEEDNKEAQRIQQEMDILKAPITDYKKSRINEYPE